MQIIQSNRLEVLFAYLKAALFTGCKSAIARRLVIVPSQKVKGWIIDKLVEEDGIAMGLEFLTLDLAIETLKTLHFPAVDEKVPSETSLFFAIYSELQALFNQEEYLKGQDEAGLVLLASDFAKLFVRYGKFGRGLVSKFNEESEGEESDSFSLQKKIWHLVRKKHPKWLSEIEVLTELSKKFTGEKKWSGDLEVHLFALSFISEVEFDFFNAFQSHYPVSYYMLSACRFFWSDLLTKWELKHLIGKLKVAKQKDSVLLETEHRLREGNRLLANLGKVGREMARMIEKQSTDSFEPISTFIVPEGQRLSLLNAVQKKLSELEPFCESDRVDLPFDSSIELHRASTKLREVQVLYDRLLHYIEKDGSITAHDIIVMAPNILEYAPYIQAVFGSDESVFEYQVLDRLPASQNSYLKAFKKLLNMLENRWESEAVLEFLSDPIVLMAQKWSSDEAIEIKNWVKKGSIRWGKDEKERKAHIGPLFWGEGSWEFGFSRLLRALVVDDSQEGPSALNLSYSSSTLLGEWIDFLKKLFLAVKPLENNSSMTFKAWSEHLKALFELCFAVVDEEKQLEGQEALLNAISTLKMYSNEFKDDLFSFKCVQKYLDDSWTCEKMLRYENCRAVRFCSLLPMRLIPAKVVALCGLHLGAFPRRSQENGHCQLKNDDERDFCPSQSDFDRYLFLEAILSARSCLFMSYSNQDGEEESEALASNAIGELFDALDLGFSIGGKKPSESIIFNHPVSYFSERYFDGTSGFISYSKSAFKAAVASLLPEKKPAHLFIDHFPSPTYEYMDKGLQVEDVEIASLKKLAKDPLKFFYEEGLEFKLEGEKEENSDHELFELPLYQYQNFAKKALSSKMPLSSLYSNLEKRGGAPMGMYGQFSKKHIEERFSNTLKAIKVDENSELNCYTLSFSQAFKGVNIGQDFIIRAEPLKIRTRHAVFQIVGEIPLVTPKGLIALSKRESSNLMKMLPEYLIYLVFCKKYFPEWELKVIFTEKGTPFSANLEEAEKLLSLYLDYYAMAKKSPSPCYPDWIEPLIELQEDEKKFLDLLKSSKDDKSAFPMPYKDEFINQVSSCTHFEMNVEWGRFVNELFGPVNQLIHRKSKDQS